MLDSSGGMAEQRNKGLRTEGLGTESRWSARTATTRFGCSLGRSVRLRGLGGRPGRFGLGRLGLWGFRLGRLGLGRLDGGRGGRGGRGVEAGGRDRQVGEE